MFIVFIQVYMYLYLYTKNIFVLFRLVYLYLYTCLYWLFKTGIFKYIYLFYICFKTGIFWLELMGYYSSGWSLVLIGLAEAMVFAWVYCEYWQLPIIGVFNSGFLT